jgi:hypothetical protein
MRRTKLLLMGVALCCAACAVEGTLADMGEDTDALPPPPPPPLPVGGAGGAPPVGGMMGQGGMMPPPVGGMMGQGGMMPPPVGGMMGEGGAPMMGGGECQGARTCSPGERLGLCEVCNDCGQPDLADDDDECPRLNCAGRNTYEREGNRCILIRPMLSAGRCLGPGSCRDPDDVTACGDTQRNTVATLMEECTAFQGCVGQEGPEIVAAPNGTVCGEMEEGICRGGMCDTEVGEECAAFGGTTCGIGTHTNGDPFCQVAVEVEGMHCINVCSAAGSVCQRAWSSANGCVQTEEVGCIGMAPRLICQCSRNE